MMGILESGKGRVGVFGDSSCVDDKEADTVSDSAAIQRHEYSWIFGEITQTPVLSHLIK